MVNRFPFMQMNRSLLALFLLSCAACDSGETKRLPLSGGDLDEILIIVDDRLKQTPFSDTLIHFFMEPYPVLPQPEPWFQLRIKSFTQWETAGNLLKRYRLVVFCSNEDDGSPLRKLITGRIEAGISSGRVKRHSDHFYTERDVYAKPQLIGYLLGQNETEIIGVLERSRYELFGIIRGFENQRLRAATYISGRNTLAERTYTAALGWRLEIPQAYFVKASDTDFVWLADEKLFRDNNNIVVREMKKNLCSARIYPHMLNGEMAGRGLDLESAVRIRNLISSRYFHGRTRSDAAYVDMAIPPEFNMIGMDGKKGVEIRGLWRMDNPIMGGPFITWIWQEIEPGSYGMIDAFAYAAGAEKRPVMRELEFLMQNVEMTPLQ